MAFGAFVAFISDSVAAGRVRADVPAETLADVVIWSSANTRWLTTYARSGPVDERYWPAGTGTSLSA